MTTLDNIIGCNFELIVSYKDKHPNLAKETYSLARTIQSKGVNVILTPVCWPRDSFFFHDDDTYTFVQMKNDSQVEHAPHWGWWGGAYVTGEDFIIADTNGIPSKRKVTLDALNVSRGFFIETQKFYDNFKDISVSGNLDFYVPESLHIDPYFNIGNMKKKIFTWNAPSLIKEANNIAREVNYEVVDLPIEDARFAAIGFIELGNHIVIDCRAEESMKIIQDLGYKIIPTDEPLIETNKHYGSLRCKTKEAPIMKHKMKFHPFQYGYDEAGGPAQFSLFSNLEGNMMVMSTSKYRKLREPLFSYNNI